MTIRRTPMLAAIVPLLMFVAPGARAQFAVIDAASVGQLVQEAQTLAQQLQAARAELIQVQAQYQAMTGNRGMQSLLSGTVRNYLPTAWPEIDGLVQGSSGSYTSLSSAYQTNLTANAVLSTQQVAALPDVERGQIVAARDSVALLQALSQVALSNASGRFAAIQQLIDAIPAASDQKGILDLQARINAEQGMLQNEQNKLQVLFQSVQGQGSALRERGRELVISGHGQFATRFEPLPP